MSRRHAEVTLAWADGDYTFRLAIKQLMELQDKCNAGPAFILSRLMQGTWFVNDIRETVRLGLIGGGMDPAAALKLVRWYVEERPLAESIMLAKALLMAVILPIEDDPLGKPEAPKDPSESTAKSPSAQSTETVLQ